MVGANLFPYPRKQPSSTDDQPIRWGESSWYYVYGHAPHRSGVVMTGRDLDLRTHWIDKFATALCRTHDLRMNRRLFGSAGLVSLVGAAILGERAHLASAKDDPNLIATLADA